MKKYINKVGKRITNIRSYQKHRKSRLERLAKYYEKNKERLIIRACVNKKIHRKRNPDAGWTRQLKEYGLTPDQYIELMFECGALCSICRQPETMVNRNGGVVLLAVDHCHKTGKVRGLLCSTCNRGLGIFNDSTLILQQAIDYLDKCKFML